MRIATDQLVCHYHKAVSGVAYTATGSCRSAPVVHDIVQLLRELPAEATMRVLGVQENAEFILRCRAERPDIALEIGGPGLCVYADELRHPDLVIQRMRQALLSPSLGGFHRFSYADLAAYRLVQSLHDSKWSAAVQAAADAHPAWYDLTFLPTLFPAAAAKLLATIIDPRWFVDLRHPDKISRVKLFLGLTPAVQRRVATGEFADVCAQRCALVLTCWHGGRRQTYPDLAAPGNFLWRVRASAVDPIVGDLRASQTFVNYLIRTWQHRIAQETISYLKEPLFVPEKLLRRGDVDEVTAYNDFIARRRDGPQNDGSV